VAVKSFRSLIRLLPEYVVMKQTGHKSSEVLAAYYKEVWTVRAESSQGALGSVAKQILRRKVWDGRLREDKVSASQKNRGRRARAKAYLPIKHANWQAISAGEK